MPLIHSFGDLLRTLLNAGITLSSQRAQSAGGGRHLSAQLEYPELCAVIKTYATMSEYSRCLEKGLIKLLRAKEGFTEGMFDPIGPFQWSVSLTRRIEV